MKTITKTITLPSSIYKKINNQAKNYNVTFSEFIVESTLRYLSIYEHKSLLEYMNKNCKHVDKREQIEIEGLNIDFDNIDGRELTLNELLEG